MGGDLGKSHFNGVQHGSLQWVQEEMGNEARQIITII